MINLNEINQMRRNLGLTQKQLAEKAGVSQSLIAKIEAGKIEPTYSKVQKIFTALNNLVRHEGAKADEIMNRHVLSLNPESTAEMAVAAMKKHAISQIPIVKTTRCLA